jgi:hypothetical protein
VEATATDAMTVILQVSILQHVVDNDDSTGLGRNG